MRKTSLRISAIKLPDSLGMKSVLVLTLTEDTKFSNDQKYIYIF